MRDRDEEVARDRDRAVCPVLQLLARILVERLPLRSCQRRGAAIDVIAQRARENRSQLVFTTARGRDAVFWQAPRTRKQARPNVRTPTARAHGIAELQILVDAHERYPYRFGTQQVSTVRRASNVVVSYLLTYLLT